MSEVYLTPGEERLFKILGRRKKKPFTTKELVELYYDGHPPEHGLPSIVGVTRRLVNKTKRAKVRVKRSGRSGPNPMTVWLEHH